MYVSQDSYFYSINNDDISLLIFLKVQIFSYFGRRLSSVLHQYLVHSSINETGLCSNTSVISMNLF